MYTEATKMDSEGCIYVFVHVWLFIYKTIKEKESRGTWKESKEGNMGRSGGSKGKGGSM